MITWILISMVLMGSIFLVFIENEPILFPVGILLSFLLGALSFSGSMFFSETRYTGPVPSNRIIVDETPINVTYIIKSEYPGGRLYELRITNIEHYKWHQEGNLIVKRGVKDTFIGEGPHFYEFGHRNEFTDVEK